MSLACELSLLKIKLFGFQMPDSFPFRAFDCCNNQCPITPIAYVTNLLCIQNKKLMKANPNPKVQAVTRGAMGALAQAAHAPSPAQALRVTPGELTARREAWSPQAAVTHLNRAQQYRSRHPKCRCYPQDKTTPASPAEGAATRHPAESTRPGQR